jgi:hypothetical protein
MAPVDGEAHFDQILGVLVPLNQVSVHITSNAGWNGVSFLFSCNESPLIL